MRFYKNVADGYVEYLSTNAGKTEITETEYREILEIVRKAPTAEIRHTYKLRDDALEWELVELPYYPASITEDEALVRYSNELTGSNDQTLEEASETLIKIVKEDM